jgi:two-component system response regulator HydG
MKGQEPVPSRVLIVDDDLDMREGLGMLFTADGHACVLVANSAAALEIVDRQTFDVIIGDIRMEGMDGLELLDRVQVSHPALPFVVLTGSSGIAQAVDAVKRGAFDYVVKPFDVEALRTIVTAALDARLHPGELARPAHPGPLVGHLEFVGTGTAMRTLQTAIDFVARSSAPVLVTGETGVGKELVARAIHARSLRASRPFIAVNTSAIPQELLEGEIFGHARGGFTGAVHARKGLLTEADGGTLLLDEIGDMSFGLQAKLLRVLQFGDVRPVGSDHVHHVDVRIIALTHRDLPALVKEGRFREDLYFRLDVLSVSVPPLRDHREDIPALAARFLAQACARAPTSPVRSIGSDALRALSERDWPGNVRELASTIERAVVFGVHEMIDTHHLPGAPGAVPVSRWPFPNESPWTLERLSHAYADWLLAQTGGDKKRAAEIMGVNLSTIYRWRRSPSD